MGIIGRALRKNKQWFSVRGLSGARFLDWRDQGLSAIRADGADRFMPCCRQLGNRAFCKATATFLATQTVPTSLRSNP